MFIMQIFFYFFIIGKANLFLILFTTPASKIANRISGTHIAIAFFHPYSFRRIPKISRIPVIAEVRLCYFEKNILTATRTSRMLKIFLRVLSGIDKANFDENQLPAIKATAIISAYFRFTLPAL